MALRATDRPTEAELAAALALRERVFIVEQGVPAELERDGLDGEARHVVLLDEGGVARATGRLLLRGEDAKVQRVAVDAARRGQGLGREVMAALERLAAEGGARRTVLASQVTAIPFYERLGYAAWGEVFLDAGLEHRWMAKALR